MYVYTLDAFCRAHDVAYMTGVPPEDADAKLLEDMYTIRHPYLPLFVAIFEAKRYYELIAGTKYTSSLYYFQEENKSLAYVLWQKSVYDNKNRKKGELQVGIDLEKRWQKILHDIRIGYCYAPKSEAPTRLV